MDYADSAARGEWSNVYSANYRPVIKENTVTGNTMPNVKGMGLKDALYLLESLGLKVTIKGKGKVASQSVSPGAALEKGSVVVLELNALSAEAVRRQS
jgi:cell division protein FtsI (penicillin-binding protein 3)